MSAQLHRSRLKSGIATVALVGLLGACGAEPEGAEPQIAEPEGAEPQSAEPEGAEPEGAEPQSAEPEGAEPEGAAAGREPLGLRFRWCVDLQESWGTYDAVLGNALAALEDYTAAVAVTSAADDELD